MKLLALRICEHDSNFTYFDGEKLSYLKTERKYQIKHHGVQDLHKWEDIIEEQWGIRSKDLNEIAIVFDPWKYNLSCRHEEFFPVIENYKDFPADCKVTRVNHHYAHHLSCWPIIDNPQDKLGFVIDGFGDLHNSWSVFKNNQLVERGDLIKHGSLGQEMLEAGYKFPLQCNPLDNAGSLMALQSYGNIDIEFLAFIQQFDIYNVHKLFNYKWYVHKQNPLDWIRTIHHYVPTILLQLFKAHGSRTTDPICYSGGVALNVAWNSVLKRNYSNIHIPPHANDEGLSLGAMEYLRIKHNLPKFNLPNFPFCQSDEAPKSILRDKAMNKIVDILSQGKVIGWYQGNGEIGPRALGNRSILADPRNPHMKKRVNEIKFRLDYRPFGASTINPHAMKSPYMLFAEHFDSSKYPAVAHIDNTCRHHTTDNNSLLNELIQNYYNKTGCDTLLNTSLNVMGKPLVSNFGDAWSILTEFPLDGLVYGGELYLK